MAGSKAKKKSVFLYEHLSAGGMADDAAVAHLLPQGLAMRDAVASDLRACGDCALTVAGSSACAARSGEDAPAFVARLARQHDAVWVIAPETEGRLAALQSAAAGARWIGCDATAVALASSKAATVEHLHARGVPTPRAARPAGAHRWVVKPDDGAGAVDTRVHATLAQAQADLAHRPGSCMEPWIEGESFSLSLLCRRRGCELLSVNRQRIAVGDGGDVCYAGVEIDVLPRHHPRHGALAALADAICAALPGLRGFVGVDLVWHAQHGPVVIEVNPRLTCAYVGLSRRLSRNLGSEVLAEFADA